MTKVLIVSLDNVGDTILGLAVLDALAKQPGLKAAFWTKDYAKDIISLYSKDVQHYHCDPYWDRSPGTGKGRLLPFLGTLLKIRRARFDVAIILHANWRKNLACLLAGIPLRCAARGLFANRVLDIVPRDHHVLATARRLAEAATGKDPGELRCAIPWPEAPSSPRTAELCASGRWAVIHPFSGNPKRNLPLASWAEIAAALAARQLKIFVNADQAEKDLFLAAVPAATASFHFACDHSASLRDLAYVISRAKIFVGNNSGPLHLASALNTPCVGIYERRDVHYIEPRGVRPPRLLIFENSPEEIKAADVTGEIVALLGTA